MTFSWTSISKDGKITAAVGNELKNKIREVADYLDSSQSLKNGLAISSVNIAAGEVIEDAFYSSIEAIDARKHCVADKGSHYSPYNWGHDSSRESSYQSSDDGSRYRGHQSSYNTTA